MKDESQFSHERKCPHITCQLSEFETEILWPPYLHFLDSLGNHNIDSFLSWSFFRGEWDDYVTWWSIYSLKHILILNQRPWYCDHFQDLDSMTCHRYFHGIFYPLYSNFYVLSETLKYIIPWLTDNGTSVPLPWGC